MKSPKTDFVEDKAKEPKPQDSNLHMSLCHKSDDNIKIAWEEFIMLRFMQVK